MTAPIAALDVTVAHRDATARDAPVLTLVARDGGRLPAWTPGSHIDVVMPGDTVRQYSLCGDPSDDTWRIAVLREEAGRGGSRWLADHALPGASLSVAGPRNHFEFEPSDAPVLLLAAGIGVTPIAAMARESARTGRDYRVAYAGRTREAMALLDEMVEAHGDRLTVHVSDEGTRADLSAQLADVPDGTVVYACGPPRFLEAVQDAAGERGLELRVEHFSPVELTSPVREESFEVELAMSGITVEVPPGTSILSAVEAEGVLVLSSCTEGTCGTCETPVLEGEVDHRDSILTPSERDRHDVMYVCVSRAACPRLVLDL